MPKNNSDKSYLYMKFAQSSVGRYGRGSWRIDKIKKNIS